MEDRTLLSTLSVTSFLDNDSPGTLRYEVAIANPGDTINFAASTNGKTIVVNNSSIEINKALDIEGNGAGKTTISGGGSTQLFLVDAGDSGPITIGKLTLTDGQSDSGGAITETSVSVLTLNSDTVSFNTANGNSVSSGQGGGVFVDIGSAARGQQFHFLQQHRKRLDRSGLRRRDLQRGDAHGDR